jgi:hypothetical protein
MGGGFELRIISMRVAVSDEGYIAQFEGGVIAPENFHHCDHVRLAFAYLRNYPVLAALERFSSALKKFAAAAGKADRYNETITYAYLFLIRERMGRGCPRDWEEFASQNPDLLLWRNGILDRYYEESTLKSELARRVFIFPDKL